MVLQPSSNPGIPDAQNLRRSWLWKESVAYIWWLQPQQAGSGGEESEADTYHVSATLFNISKALRL